MTKQQMLDLIVYKLNRLNVPDLRKVSSNIFDDLQRLTNISKSQTQKFDSDFFRRRIL